MISGFIFSILLSSSTASIAVLNDIKLKIFKKEHRMRENIYLMIHYVLLGVLSIKVTISSSMIVFHPCFNQS